MTHHITASSNVSFLCNPECSNKDTITIYTTLGEGGGDYIKHFLNHLSGPFSQASRLIINKNTIYIRPRILTTLFVRLFPLYPICNILADVQWGPHPLASIAVRLR